MIEKNLKSDSKPRKKKKIKKRKLSSNQLETLPHSQDCESDQQHLSDSKTELKPKLEIAEPDSPESSGTRVSPVVHPQKRQKSGIIYFSSIPDFITVKKIRAVFSHYGELGRIFLQPETRKTADGKTRKRYTEGWIEFKSKSVAKRVALSLNNTQVGGKRRSKSYEQMWNIKYLNRFKWLHLTEQLAYEQAVRKQRMRTEISQAKKEANFFAQQVDKGRHLKQLEEKVLRKGGLWEKYQRQLQQKPVIKEKKKVRDQHLMDMIFAQ